MQKEFLTYITQNISMFQILDESHLMKYHDLRSFHRIERWLLSLRATISNFQISINLQRGCVN